MGGGKIEIAGEFASNIKSRSDSRTALRASCAGDCYCSARRDFGKRWGM